MRERLEPACDARESVDGADAPELDGAGKILGTWSELHEKKGRSSTADGKQLGKGPERTRNVDSVQLVCARGASFLHINGTRYPFDLAWVVSGIGTGPTLNGDEGAGQFAMIQAISLRDKRLVFAKVYVPSDAHDDTDDTVIVASLEGYLPDADAIEDPLVRVVSEPSNPQLETFVLAKGAEHGVSFRVPRQGAVGRARFLSVARFAIAEE